MWRRDSPARPAAMRARDSARRRIACATLSPGGSFGILAACRLICCEAATPGAYLLTSATQSFSGSAGGSPIDFTPGPATFFTVPAWSAPPVRGLNHRTV